jgi:hypothetical protein
MVLLLYEGQWNWSSFQQPSILAGEIIAGCKELINCGCEAILFDTII